MPTHRALVFQVPWEDSRLKWLLAEFRRLVNESIRTALQGDHRSRARLARAAYQDLGARHAVYKQYIPSAFEIALGVLKVYRRRVRKGKRTTTPFMRRLMLKAENQSYRLDRETGRLRIPIRGTEGVQLHLPLSEWHRSLLSDPSWGLGSLTVVPGKVIIVVRKEPQKPYEPDAAIALDTNEDSLDGVFADADTARLVTLPFDGVRRIQAIHFRRRRLLARKKARDRRVQRRLLAREGRRERHRVTQRLHKVSKTLVAAAKPRGPRSSSRTSPSTGREGSRGRRNAASPPGPAARSTVRSNTRPPSKACQSSRSTRNGRPRPAQRVAPGAEVGWARTSCATCATGKWIDSTTPP